VLPAVSPGIPAILVIGTNLDPFTWYESAEEILGRLTYDHRLIDKYEHEPRWTGPRVSVVTFLSERALARYSVCRSVMDGREGRPLVRLLIVVGSTRSVRVGDQIGEVVARAARSLGGVEPVVEDLREWALPLLDEPAMPAVVADGGYRNEHSRAWAATVSAADAVVPQSAYGDDGRLPDAEQVLAAHADELRVALASLAGAAAEVGA
jgi:hypothetical protein